MDLFPLWNSLRISMLATFFTFFLGIFAAHQVAKLPTWLKGLLDTVLTIPMVLPPTVVGFFILITIGPKGPIGFLLKSWFNYTVTMKWHASVIAVFIVTFPLMYRTVRGAFEAFDKNLLYAGQTLGLSNTFIFWHILLPNTRLGIIAGTILSFARGLGEYGATTMVSGYIANRTATISTSVAYFWQTNQDAQAYYWVTVNLLISFAVMFTINLFERRQKKPHRKREA